MSRSPARAMGVNCAVLQCGDDKCRGGGLGGSRAGYFGATNARETRNLMLVEEAPRPLELLREPARSNAASARPQCIVDEPTYVWHQRAVRVRVRAREDARAAHDGRPDDDVAAAAPAHAGDAAARGRGGADEGGDGHRGGLGVVSGLIWIVTWRDEARQGGGAVKREGRARAPPERSAAARVSP